MQQAIIEAFEVNPIELDVAWLETMRRNGSHLMIRSSSGAEERKIKQILTNLFAIF
jgi:hypothetical protein